jgi:Tfp pilus assembly protein PilO
MNNHIPPIIALVVAACIFFFYVSPTWSGSIASTKAAIASDDRALEAAGEYVAQQNELASSRNNIDPADLDRLAVFLPDSVDNVRLILDLNALASRSGLLISNIDVTKNDIGPTNGKPNSNALQAIRAKPIGSIDLSLSAVGSYAAFRSFLTGVEKSARLLDVLDIVVMGSNTGVYTYKMVLRLYWLR